jgi:hypothetical protein
LLRIAVDGEPMDCVREVVGPAAGHEQSLDIVVDQRAQVRSAPSDDRHSGRQGLGHCIPVGLHATRKGEGVGDGVDRSERGRCQRAVDHHPPGQVRLRDPAPDEPRVLGRDVGPTDEMEGHVVTRHGCHGFEQLVNPFVG